MLVERGTARLEFSDGIFAIASTVLLEISVLAGSGTTVCVRSLTSDPRFLANEVTFATITPVRWG